MVTLKIRRVGDSLGATFPPEVLERMHVSEGDVLVLTEAADGYRLTPMDPEFASQMERARDIMKENRTVLRELAK